MSRFHYALESCVGYSLHSDKRADLVNPVNRPLYLGVGTYLNARKLGQKITQLEYHHVLVLKLHCVNNSSTFRIKGTNNRT